MIIAAGSALTAPASSRPDAVTRDDDATPTEGKVAKDVGKTRPEFGALLALLAGVSLSARSEAARTVPADGASIVDRLLNGPGTPEGEATGEPEPGDATSAIHRVIAAMRTSGNSREQAVASALESALGGDTQSPMTLSDALRYGLMQDASRATLSAARGDDRRAVATAPVHGMSVKTLTALDDFTANAGSAEGARWADGTVNAAALAAALVASAGDVTTPAKDASALAPELRARLDRVISRMRDEYGSDVKIVETARSQERQDALYAQGRSRPGNVVTWTRDSAHTRGEAVDVMVDGTFNNAEGFARLQRIAREEGLRTLGVKDPGHLELLRDSRLADPAASVAGVIDRRAAGANPARPVPVPNAAPTPAVASVASVAGVASVATMARPGSGNATRPAERGSTANSMMDGSALARDAVAGLTAIDASSTGASSTGASSTGTRRDNPASDARRDTNDDAPRPGDIRKNAATRTSLGARFDASAMNASAGTETATRLSNGTASATAAVGISSAERVADVQQLRSDAPAVALSRMTLDVDGPNGVQRVTVDLRGNVVDTQISTDAQSADRLRMHTGELQDALGRHGLEADSVRISGTSRLDPANARAMVGEREGIVLTQTTSSNGGADSQTFGQSTRDRAVMREWERNEDARKSRDEQQEERQNAERQNAGQRGQRSTFNKDAR